MENLDVQVAVVFGSLSIAWVVIAVVLEGLKKDKDN